VITIVDGMCECNYTLKTFWLDERDNHKFYIIYRTKWGQGSLYLKNNWNTSMNWINVLGVILMTFNSIQHKMNTWDQHFWHQWANECPPFKNYVIFAKQHSHPIRVCNIPIPSCHNHIFFLFCGLDSKNSLNNV
jgi:hypothetical protein